MRDRKGKFSGQFRMAAWILLLVFLASVVSGCSQGLVPQPTSTSEPSATMTMVPTELPTATATPQPTATLEPSATPTQPPTETPVPPLAVLADGFSAWCAPQSYRGVKPAGPDAPADASLLTTKDGGLQVKIPAGFCTMIYRFNQSAPADATLVLFDASSAFLKIPLQAVAGRPDEVWASVSHDFVINPPLWEVTYRLVVLDGQGKELWAQPVKFAKTLPNPCPYGGLPDPVTLWCAITDPLEIEPHPDITFPAYYTRVPPSN